MPEKKKYYAIKVGKNVTDKIVNSWEECKELVIGYPSVYRSFKSRKEAELYIKNMTDEKIEIQLMWNEIHRKHRLKEKLEMTLGFKIPMYIAEELMNTDLTCNKEKIFLLINMGLINNRLSKKNAEKLRKYVNMC